ncbi:MAG: T9SS type A sorting domain-containing protein [Bacteroidales bacterium]|nr:T9SS type A sorting domain-containing protein [Bacteroidales bacterium]
MPFLDLETLQREDLANERLPMPFRFGYPHDVNLSLSNSGIWKTTEDGGRLWNLKIYSPDALSLNLLYDQFWLPEGAKFFIYSTDMKQHIGAFSSKNNTGDKNNNDGFATGFLFSNSIILEYYEPAGVIDNGTILVSQVISGYRYIYDIISNDNRADTLLHCNNDVNCLEGDNWQLEKNAVACMIMGFSTCTGALINTTANDTRPVFLTANHCYESSVNLKQWMFYWHYEAPTCDSIVNWDSNKSTSGCKLLSRREDTDFMLLELLEDPANNNNVNPYYLGWDRRSISSPSGACIHHPLRAQKKISLTENAITIWPDTICWGKNCSQGISLPYTHWLVSFTNGTTQGGSSGSPLLNQSKRVIGQLHGGFSGCPPWINKYYGRFDLSWDGNSSSTRLKDWLDPNGTNALTLNGVFYCKKNLYINNKTYKSGSNTSEQGCVITISNTIIQSGAKVRFYAGDKIVINSETYIRDGSNVVFEIRATGSRGETKSGSDYSNPEEPEELYTDEEMLTSLQLAMNENEINEVDFTIFPNPNDGNFTIRILGLKESYTLQIFNAMGLNVGEINCNEETVHVNKSELSAGLYYVKMIANEKILVKKVVVQ